MRYGLFRGSLEPTSAIGTTESLPLRLSSKPVMHSAVLFRTHRRNPYVLAEFFRMRADCLGSTVTPFLSYDSTVNDTSFDDGCVHLFTVDDLKREFPVHAPERQLWHNPETALVDFYRRRPSFDYYWLIEYDVTFAGTWSDFFAAFSQESGDFIASKIKSQHPLSEGLPHAPDWCWWPNLNFSVEPRLGCFFPVTRFSRSAMQVLDRELRAGKHGFCEVLVPTLMLHAGMTIVDLKSFPQVYAEEFIQGAQVIAPIQHLLYHAVQYPSTTDLPSGMPRPTPTT